MADLSRRDVFKLGAAGALGLAALPGARPARAAAEVSFKPEAGASLLRKATKSCGVMVSITSTWFTSTRSIT